jgi:hypothetical protein
MEKEKFKPELHKRHSDCHWVKVNKRAENMERSTEKKAIV